jgi:hypothetical protein
LGGASGDVFALGGNQFAVNLLNGAGFETLQVPEPGSLALFSIVALFAAGTVIWKRRTAPTTIGRG